MRKPYVWQMIKSAVDNLNGEISYTDIKNYIKRYWDSINPLTVTDQIQVLTVNHNSRIHYPENNKPRLTNSNSPYDLLFTIGRGRVVKYDPTIHGIWEIYVNEEEKLAVKKVAENVARVYTPADILWFKNVTNSIDGQAYMEQIEGEFILHFPTHHKGNVLRPAVGELILIYQKINGIPAFTHLVTPIDYKLHDETRPNFRYGRKVRIIAKTDRNSFIPVSTTLWSQLKLSGVTQGNACKIDNIKQISKVDDLRFDIWQRFSSYFIQTEQPSVAITAALINELEISNPELTVTEGELRLVSHLVKERNREIVKEKKRLAIKDNILHCEVCKFSFAQIYGADFIECHHLSPIGESGVRETKLEDLALVCANCHRMLHSKFDGHYLTIIQLAQRIKTLNNSL